MKIFLAICILLSPLSLTAEEEEVEVVENINYMSSDLVPTQPVGILLGISYFPEGCYKGSRATEKCNDSFISPTLGLAYRYFARDNLTFNLVGDLEYAYFQVETRDLDTGERNKELITQFIVDVAVTAGWRFVPNLELGIGPGVQFGRYQTVGLLRFSLVYYSIKLTNWYLQPFLNYDLQNKSTDKFSFGFSLAR